MGRSAHTKESLGYATLCVFDRVFPPHPDLSPGRGPGGEVLPTIKAPNTKYQTPKKLQAPSSKLEARAAVWSLELGISLVFAAWFLVFRFGDFSGAWCLGFGVSFSHLLSPAHRCKGGEGGASAKFVGIMPCRLRHWVLRRYLRAEPQLD